MGNGFSGWRRISPGGLAVWGCLAASCGILIYLLLSPGSQGIPGWQPANGSLRATLALGDAAALPSTQTLPVAPAQSAAQAPTAVVDAVPSGAPSAGSSSAARTAPDDNPALLDLNAATAAELDELPGIGPTKAQAIVVYRDSRHGFRDVEELLEVKGIGPKLYAQIQSLVAVRKGPK